MSSPFKLTELPNRTWAVSWPEFEDRFNDQMKVNLLDLIFSEIECDETGLGVTLDDKEELSILWIKRPTWQQELPDEYSRYLHKYYRIQGAVFYEYDEAAKFREILEKRYAWQLLKA